MPNVNFEEMEYYDSLKWKTISEPTIADLSTININDYPCIVRAMHDNYDIPDHLKLDISDHRSLLKSIYAYGQREGIDKDKVEKVYLKRLLKTTERILIIDSCYALIPKENLVEDDVRNAHLLES